MALTLFGASQPAALAATGFDLTLVRPSPSGAAYVQQESVSLLPAGTWAWAVVANGSWDPLILREPATNQHQGGLIEWRAETTASVAWAPLDRLTLAMSLAGVPWQTGSGGTVPLSTAATSPRHQALGDASLLVKVGLLGAANHPGFRVAVSGELFSPTGQAASYAGSGGWTALARLWGGYLGTRTSLTLGIGYDLVPRADVPLAGILIDDRWTGSAAGSLRVTTTLTLLAEAQASVLFETARRGYQRGFVTALHQTPAYALAGARIEVCPRGQLLLAAWRGLDASPGAAKLGLMAGWSATWDGPFAPHASPATAKNETVRDDAQLGQPGAKEQEDALGKSNDDRAQDLETSPEPRAARAEDAGEAGPGRGNEKGRGRGKKPDEATPPCPSGDCAEAEANDALVRLENGQLVLAAPLPFKGRSAKLAAASIPILRAIAKVMKDQPVGARLTIRLESVGSRPLDLALAKKRAQALRGVFAHLARWPAKRISALGVPSSGTGADVAKPPLTLELATPQARVVTDPVPTAEEPEAPEKKPTAEAPCATGDCETREKAESGDLAKRQGDEIILAGPLPFQGKSAKLAAASIPALKAIAKIMKGQPAGTHLTLSLEAVGNRRADLALARKRAQALRGVFAHLARWPAQRISAVGVAPTSAATGTTTDASADAPLPPLSLRLR